MAFCILFGSMREKRIGQGEDSDPILFRSSHSDEFISIGVLDGMGGAGGSECVSDYSKDNVHKTKAYVASRIIRDAIEELLNISVDNNSIQDFGIRLKDTILKRYEEEKKKYPSKSKVTLRSSLIKDYPTTLALVTVRTADNHFIIDSYWAGDSRNYLWTSDGLFQISRDDLRGEQDPLENLREDAPMSNCIYCGGDFEINQIRIDNLSSSDKIILISATDGCFGYYPSPMDFERVLKETLIHSKSFEDWEEKLIKEFDSVTADDFSFAIATLGFDTIKDIKNAMSGHSDNSYKCYFRERSELERQIRKAERKLTILNKRKEQGLLRSWSDYKNTYLKYVDKK